MPSGVYERTSEHNAANSRSTLGIPNSPEHNIAISKATLGIPKSPRTDAHKATMSESLKNSEAMQLEHDRQRGGHDIVGHHMIYDHSDLTRNIMPMTRSMHTKLHELFRKHGIIIPHINIEEEP